MTCPELTVNPAFCLHQPKISAGPVIFASPHSGRDYAGTFAGQSVLNDHVLRSSEDVRVDGLIAHGRTLGVPVISAHAPRAFVDLNRDEHDLDPALIEGVTRRHGNIRVSAGLGVIARVVAEQKQIYRGKISRQAALARLADYWHPYHDRLAQLMQAQHMAHGMAILLDFHSMPATFIGDEAQAPEIVLGDRHGQAADEWVMACVEQVFVAAGFRVRRNVPFAGAYILRCYGRPHENWHGVQIEINRGLYQDPADPFGESDRFKAFQARLRPVLEDLARLGMRGRMAAE